VIGVMGASHAAAARIASAHELGRLLAERGWIVLTGGRPAGVMAAASAGAKSVPGSLTVGILPSAAGDVAPDVDIAIFTGMGEARNAINVLSSDVVVACGLEGPGTASEVALAIRAGKPLVLLDATPAARSFVRDIGGAAGARVLEAGSPAEVVRALEQELMVPRGAEWSAAAFPSDQPRSRSPV
jgi:uncharacterized protein (TIGR00725 family)